MTEKWTNAFGEVPEPFEARVRRTVARMEAADAARERPARRVPRLRAALVCAIAMTLLVGAALALSGLGVLDTLNEGLRAFLLPGAEKLVQTAIPQTVQQPEHAAFTLEEAVNDGHQIYATVRVHGDEDVLLMDAGAEPAMALDYWRGGAGQTFSSRAGETGRRLICAGCAPVDASGALLSVSAPETAYDGEDILYTLSWPAASAEVQLRLTTYDLYGAEDTALLSVGELCASIPVTDARRFAATALPVTIPTEDGDLLLSDLQIEQTPIATYMHFVFGVADPADEVLAVRLADGLWPEWLDESGSPYPEGENGNELRTDAAGNTCYTVVYPAAAQLPESITIRFHDGMRNGGDVTITLPVYTTEPKEE